MTALIRHTYRYPCTRDLDQRSLSGKGRWPLTVAISTPSFRFVIIFSTPTCKKFHVAPRSSLLGAGGMVMGIVVDFRKVERVG